MRTLAVVTIACAALAFASTAHAGRTEQLRMGATTVDVTFGEGAKGAPDWTVHNHLKSMIYNARDGSTMIVALHRYDDGNWFEEALRYARDVKGMDVWVIYNGADGGLDWIGSGRLRKCRWACLSATDASPYGAPKGGEDSNMHSKFVLFDQGRMPDGTYNRVTWAGSANMDLDSAESWNNAVTYYGDGDVWWNLWGVWKDMWDGWARTAYPGTEYGPNFNYLTVPADNPYTLSNGYFTAPNAATTGIMSPSQTRQVWHEQFEALTPPGEGGSQPCYVGVMQWFVGGNAGYTAARELVHLARYGCPVRIVVNRRDDGRLGLDDRSRTTLCDGVRNGADLQVWATRKMHNKAAFAIGQFLGRPNWEIVWTGSHNLSDDALRKNAEVMLRLEGSTTLVNHYNDELALAVFGHESRIC